MLLKDPLVHFLVIGALLFAFLTWYGDEPPAGQILITADSVADLRRSAQLLQGRAPTEEELMRMVEAVIREEVYYREALARGLDDNDDEVKRRLVEKMQYLSENLADPEPTDADLRSFFDQAPERFLIPAQVSFDQVFFSPRMRGEALAADAATALTALANGADPAELGDSTPLNGRFEAADANRIGVLFGDALTAAVFSEDFGGWLGPYESDFGWHLIRVIERSESRQPSFTEAEEQIGQAFAVEQLRLANEAAFADMREHFDIRVQWDANGDSEPWP